MIIRQSSHENRPGLLRFSCGVLLVGAVIACGGSDRPSSSGESAAAPPPTVASAPPSGGAEPLYQRCVTCHQVNGQGVPGAFPPLAGSEYATAANAAVPIRIVLHGMQGPLTVKGQQYSGIMLPFGTGVEMTDQEVATLLTYVRQSWGNNASAVTPEQVANERSAERSATGMVTAEELQALM